MTTTIQLFAAAVLRCFVVFILGSLGLTAAPILIDNFSTDQFFGVGPGGANPISNSQGASTGANSIGGARNATITRLSGSNFNFINLSGGILEFNTAASDTGTGLILWDGGTDNVNSFGLGNTDLTGSGTNDRFRLLVRSDLVAPVTIVVYTSATDYSTASFNLPGLALPARSVKCTCRFPVSQSAAAREPTSPR